MDTLVPLLENTNLYLDYSLPTTQVFGCHIEVVGRFTLGTELYGSCDVTSCWVNFEVLGVWTDDCIRQDTKSRMYEL